MAVVRPFPAVRYAVAPGADCSAVTAPPYDVVSPEERAALLALDPHNVVALELPEGVADIDVPGNRYEVAGRRWRDWRAEGALEQDSAPTFYVLEQHYTVAGAERVRTALIGAVQLRPFSDGVVLPHERTLPKAIEDRLRMTRATAANLSQVFGLFADPDDETGPLLARAKQDACLQTATDPDGVVSTLWALTDPETIAALSDFMQSRPLFIADGHHRYTTALAYRDEQRSAVGTPQPGSPEPAYESIMMALVSMDDPGLTVLPTHRVADAPGQFDPAAFWDRLAERFEVTEVAAGHPADALAASDDMPTFLIRTRDGATRLARLRGDLDHADAFHPGASAAWKNLDVAVLQELILEPLLGISPDRPETLERLSFVKDAHQALKQAGAHDVVFILNATRMEQVAEAALEGRTMPQKSTYFYPKLLSGLLFKRLD